MVIVSLILYRFVHVIVPIYYKVKQLLLRMLVELRFCGYMPRSTRLSHSYKVHSRSVDN